MSAPARAERLPRIGTAGWAIRKEHAALFPGDGSHLERYARRLNAVEINSSFYRPHRRATYERWAASVPARFSFAVKVPRAITHELRLKKADAALDAFLEQARGLGDKLGVLLIQLPPSFAFDLRTASTFFAALRKRYTGGVAFEPRHASWFTPRAEALADQTSRRPGGGRSRGRAGCSRAGRLARARLLPPARRTAHLLVELRARTSSRAIPRHCAPPDLKPGASSTTRRAAPRLRTRWRSRHECGGTPPESVDFPQISNASLAPVRKHRVPACATNRRTQER